MKAHLPIALLTSLATAACSPHKVTRNPEAPIELPAAFTTIQAEGANLNERWWQDFGDAQLNALVSEALQENLQVRAAWERLAQARSVVTQAGAPRFPAVNLVGGISQSEPSNPFFPSSPISVEASYEVDVFNQFSNGTLAALADAQSARNQVESMAMSLVAQIADTWFALTAQRARYALLEEQIKVSENFLELAEMRLGQGLGSALDVLQQRQQLAAVAGQRPLAESAIAVLRNQLAVLTGKAPGTIELAVQRALPALPPLPSTGLPADLLLRRPDVRAARLQVEAADYRVAVAVANRLPKLRLSGNYGPFERVDTDLGLGPLWNVAANILAPLFQGGRLKAEVTRSESVVRERSYGFGQALLEAILEVENALIQESKQVAFVADLEGQLVIARAALEEARRRYRDGIGDQSFLQILTALGATQSIEQSLLQAQQQALSYRIQLCRALGGTWTKELTKTSRLSKEGSENE